MARSNSRSILLKTTLLAASKEYVPMAFGPEIRADVVPVRARAADRHRRGAERIGRVRRAQQLRHMAVQAVVVIEEAVADVDRRSRAARRRHRPSSASSAPRQAWRRGARPEPGRGPGGRCAWTLERLPLATFCGRRRMLSRIAAARRRILPTRGSLRKGRACGPPGHRSRCSACPSGRRCSRPAAAPAPRSSGSDFPLLLW